MGLFGQNFFFYFFENISTDSCAVQQEKEDKAIGFLQKVIQKAYHTIFVFFSVFLGQNFS